MFVRERVIVMLALYMLIKRIKSYGFSLIELLVVISIIATLTALLMANFMGARERARDAQKISDLGSLKNALRMYYNDHQSYPPGGVSGAGVTLTPALMANYMPGIAGVNHTYYQTNNGDGFNLCVTLEAGAGDDDINSQVKCGIGTTDVCGLAKGIGNTADKLFVVCTN